MDDRQEKPAAPNAWRGWLFSLVRYTLFAYLGVALVLIWFENRLVYQPVRADQHWLEPPASQIEDVHLVAGKHNIHGWWHPRPESDGAILYLHGNAGNLSHRGGSLMALGEILKQPVFIVDYPGYGKSAGKPSEQACYATAQASYDWLVQRGIAPEKIVVFGASLGGGVAVELASRNPTRALVLVKTFTSLPDVGQRTVPFLPVRFLMRNRFDSFSRIGKCTSPIFIAHGDVDEVVPYALGKRLYEAAGGKKYFCELPGQGHNDRLEREFYDELRLFLETHAPQEVAARQLGDSGRASSQVAIPGLTVPATVAADE